MKPNKVRSQLNTILYSTMVVMAGTGLGREGSGFRVRFTNVTQKKKKLGPILGRCPTYPKLKLWNFENS